MVSKIFRECVPCRVFTMSHCVTLLSKESFQGDDFGTPKTIIIIIIIIIIITRETDVKVEAIIQRIGDFFQASWCGSKITLKSPKLVLASSDE